MTNDESLRYVARALKAMSYDIVEEIPITRIELLALRNVVLHVADSLPTPAKTGPWLRTDIDHRLDGPR